MGTEPNSVADDAPAPEPRGVAIKAPDPAMGTKLKLIKIGLSDNGAWVHIHFVDSLDQMISVQLEIAVATNFHRNLGTLLNQLKIMETPLPLRH